MNADDRQFLIEINQRQHDAMMSDSLWSISSLEFDRAYELDKCNWNFVFLNRHTFTQTDFYNFNFRNADLDGCKFKDANLRGVSFGRAHLRETQFINCMMDNVGWYQTDLRWMTVINCDLEGMNLEQANLRLVNGIKIVSPVGSNGRTVLAYVYDGDIRIQAGCRNDVPKAMREAIHVDYANDAMNLADYLDAVNLLEKWGRREIKRLKG